MKIAYDIRPFLRNETGVGVYLKNLLFSLATIDIENRYLLFSSSFKERFKSENLPPFNNYKFKDMRIPVKLLNYLWYKKFFPPIDLFFREKADIVHSPNPLTIPAHGKKIITVHDLSFIDHPSLTTEESGKYFRKKIKRSLEKCDGIISISQFTKNRIIDLFGDKLKDKIRVIYNGSDMKKTESIKPNLKIPDRFILFTGTLEPRKNLLLLIKAFSMLKKRDENIKLILAGSADERAVPVLKKISELKLEDDVIITGYIKREEIRYLYDSCTIFVFPSHYEGFGIPVLEAASLKKPSVISDIPVFREIFENYPVYFDKDSPEDLMQKITTLLSDPHLSEKVSERGEKIAKKYSWSRAAKETLAFYMEVMG